MQIGDTYEYKNVVTKEITAGALGSGGLDIFATPFLICWMEAAAYYYMKEQLPEGKSSVGTMVNVRHVSPSPIGAEITAKAELIAMAAKANEEHTHEDEEEEHHHHHHHYDENGVCTCGHHHDEDDDDDEDEEHEHHHHHDHDDDDHDGHCCCGHHHDHDDECGCGHDHDHEEDGHDSDEVEYDEHIWTSPKNAVVLCRAICDAICKADPANEDFYRVNCDDYCAQIEALDARFASLCESAPHKLLVFADRFPMLYFCREYGLDYRAAFHGCSGDTEPSLATIKFLIDKVEDEDIPVVYTIDFGTKKVAAVVSECTGAAVDTLYSMQTVSRADFDAGETYLTLMERNYEALRKGLNE